MHAIEELGVAVRPKVLLWNIETLDLEIPQTVRGRHFEIEGADNPQEVGMVQTCKEPYCIELYRRTQYPYEIVDAD